MKPWKLMTYDERRESLRELGRLWDEGQPLEQSNKFGYCVGVGLIVVYVALMLCVLTFGLK